MGEGKLFKFKSVGSCEWSGRYKRVVGETSVFRLRYFNERGFWPVIDLQKENERVLCFAVEQQGSDVKLLIDAINEAKIIMSGQPGGSFVINEFGQVLVPSSSGDGRRMLVGEAEGVLYFEEHLCNKIIDLSFDEDMELGSKWIKPYIGIPYNLSKSSFIYYFNNNEGNIEYPPIQDEYLIKALRKIRRFGSVRFLVNPYGIVLTKTPVGEYSEDNDRWEPVYVGRINYEKWFEKEEVNHGW